MVNSCFELCVLLESAFLLINLPLIQPRSVCALTAGFGCAERILQSEDSACQICENVLTKR